MFNRFFASFLVAAVVAVAMGGGSAQAVPIDGDVSFTGLYTVDTPANLSTATKILSFSGVVVTPEPAVDNGDYEGTDGAVTTFKPFAFADAGVDPLWTFTVGLDTYSFKATSIGVSFASTNALIIEGEGIASITGLDDTPGFWSITANKARASFSFSASAAAFIPEPATVAVAALGLGTILLRRRKTA